MEYAVDLIPESVPKVKTKYRRIRTTIPGSEPAPIPKKPYDLEPSAPRGHLPVVWDYAGGLEVYDDSGNRSFDRLGGVLPFASVGTGMETLKIRGPLMVDEEALTARRREEITA